MTSPELQRAIELWVQLHGVSPDAEGRFTIRDYEVRQTYESIAEALELDETGITAELMLSYHLDEYLNSNTVTLRRLLEKPETIEKKLVIPRQLKAILTRPEVTEARTEFTANLRAALEQYDVLDREDIRKLLADPDALAHLRRDALRSIANLRVDQFLAGAHDAETVRPVYNKTVHRWWNINSLLTALPHQPSGVSLNLVMHPHSYQSYFAFAIRNGGNVFILSDTPDWDHPLQGYMTRRPDRRLDKRIAKNWFPYDLLGVEYDEDGKLYIKQAKSTALVARQSEAMPAKPIAELGAEEVVWAAMMFDLIVDKFWRAGYQAPQLSYTGEMLMAEARMLEDASAANLPVVGYQPHALAPLTVADVSADVLTEEEVGDKYEQPNRWMEERYAHKVPDAVLNVTAAPEKVYALARDTSGMDLVNVQRHEIEGRSFTLRSEDKMKGRTRLEVLDATSFGSREKLDADRKFIARVNLAKGVAQLASDEFEARKDEVLGWYRERVKANAANLARFIGHERLWLDEGQMGTFSHFHSNSGPRREIELDPTAWRGGRQHYRSLLDRKPIEKGDWSYHKIFNLGPSKHIRERYHQYDIPQCWFYKTTPSHYTAFYPCNAQELAFLAGCTVEDLPDVLQHFLLREPYHGNSILDRVDPMIWKLRNPWNELDFRVQFALSNRGQQKAIRECREMPALPIISTDRPAP